MLTYTLEKREKESLYEQLYRFIRGDILSGRLQAGEKLPQEPKMLMLGTYGSGETFFTLKGELEGIFRALRMKKAEYTAEKNNPSYHPGRCARITVDGEEIGVMGQVHPLVAKNYGIDAEVYCAELNFTKMLSSAQ